MHAQKAFKNIVAHSVLGLASLSSASLNAVPDSPDNFVIRAAERALERPNFFEKLHKERVRLESLTLGPAPKDTGNAAVFNESTLFALAIKGNPGFLGVLKAAGTLEGAKLACEALLTTRLSVTERSEVPEIAHAIFYASKVGNFQRSLEREIADLKSSSTAHPVGDQIIAALAKELNENREPPKGAIKLKD